MQLAMDSSVSRVNLNINQICIFFIQVIQRRKEIYFQTDSKFNIYIFKITNIHSKLSLWKLNT